MMRRLLMSLAAAAAILCGSAVWAQQTGTLKARIVFGGKPPAAKPIRANAAFCGNQRLVDESLLVSGENKGIRNVLLYVHTRGSEPKLPDSEPVHQTHSLIAGGCRFEPHMLVARAGDTLEVSNRDPVRHNAHIFFFNNAAANLRLPVGQKTTIEMSDAEPAPIPIESNIYPWMRAYVVVLDHPFAAVSDERGAIVIEGLPAGAVLSFRLFHESAGTIDSVTIDGQEVALRDNRFAQKINPGMNDLGEIVIPAAEFQ